MVFCSLRAPLSNVSSPCFGRDEHWGQCAMCYTLAWICLFQKMTFVQICRCWHSTHSGELYLFSLMMLLIREKDESALAWGQTQWKWHDQSGSLICFISFMVYLCRNPWVFLHRLSPTCTQDAPLVLRWGTAALEPWAAAHKAGCAEQGFPCPGQELPSPTASPGQHFYHLVALVSFCPWLRHVQFLVDFFPFFCNTQKPNK